MDVSTEQLVAGGAELNAFFPDAHAGEGRELPIQRYLEPDVLRIDPQLPRYRALVSTSCSTLGWGDVRARERARRDEPDAACLAFVLGWHSGSE
jgi:hypothetical protein